MDNSLKEKSEENNEKSFLNKIYQKRAYRMIIGAVAGAGIGWLYWEFIGCNGGSCPLSSSMGQTVFIFSLLGIWFTYRK